MHQEISAAVAWWANHLMIALPRQPYVIEAFREHLYNELVSRYENHWHENDILRGSAYRSISYHSRMDMVLLRSAKRAGVANGLEKLLAGTRNLTMFVNPGEVKVVNSALLSSSSSTADIIFSRSASFISSSATFSPMSISSASDSPLSASPLSPSSPCPSSPSSTSSLSSSSSSSDFSRSPQHRTLTQQLWEQHNMHGSAGFTGYNSSGEGHSPSLSSFTLNAHHDAPRAIVV